LATEDLQDSAAQNILDSGSNQITVLTSPMTSQLLTQENSDHDTSYICYDAKAKVNAHGSTRALYSLSLTFKQFNGL